MATSTVQIEKRPREFVIQEDSITLESCPISKQSCPHLNRISDVDERSIYMFSTCNTREHVNCPGELDLYVRITGGIN